MKALSTLATAAALAVSLAAAAPSHAAVIAQFSPLTASSDYKWVRNGAGGHLISVTSNASTTANAVPISFSFLAPVASILAFLPATFTLDATAADIAANAATFNAGSGTWTQVGIDGAFHITYTGADTVIGGFHLVPGENLLSGIFTNAWIQGGGGSGSFNLAANNGGTATFTSSVLNFASVVAGSEEFAFNLLGVTPKFNAAAGKGLNSFRANGGGNFDADTVPEPAAWALMIVGFGAAGAMLRKRRALVARA